MTIHEAYQRLVLQLFEIYADSEAHAIADWVMERVTEWKRIDRILNKSFPLSLQKQEQLEKYTHELLQHKPVQYVLGEAWFASMKFYVNEKVLIPRPETEELVEWIVKHEKLKSLHPPDGTDASAARLSIIDIGTGSGCIPIALKKKLPTADITAIDISRDALSVAVENAAANGTTIDFKQFDFLAKQQWPQLGQFDIIVSNPPYVRKTEAKEMRKSVVDFEPPLALFVPDEDALLFYKALVEFAATHLQPNGMLFMEINEALGNETVALFSGKGFTTVELKKDMQGKDRMVKAAR